MQLQHPVLHLNKRETDSGKEGRGKGVETIRHREKRRLVPFEPLRHVTSLRDEFEQAFDRFFRGFPARWTETAWTPAIDVTDEEERVVVKATLPGMDKNNLEIKVSGDTLVLTGKTEEEKEKKDKNYYIHEISAGSFRREVAQPFFINASQLLHTRIFHHPLLYIIRAPLPTQETFHSTHQSRPIFIFNLFNSIKQQYYLTLPQVMF